MSEVIILLAVVFIALPIIAIVRTTSFNRRLSDIESKPTFQDGGRNEIRELTARVFELERCLAQLRAAAPPSPAVATAAPLPPPAAAPVRPPANAATQPVSFSHPVEPAPAPTPAPVEHPEAPKELETNIGLTWINRIAALTLVLAAAFFFKYAVDNQWIGETGRIVLGVLAGFVALGIGEWSWRRAHHVYAQGVTAIGIGVLYLSFYAAFAFYHLPAVPQATAFVLMALTSAMAAMLAMRYDAAVISVLAMIGGYVTPVLLSTGEDRPWVLFGYVLLLDLGALAVGRAKRWMYLAPIAMSGTAVLYALWFANHFNPANQFVAVTAVLVYFALFALLESRPIVLVAQVLATVAVLAIATSINPAPSWIYSLAWLFVALFAAGLALAQWRGWPELMQGASAVFWICFGLWQAAHMAARPDMVVPAAVAGFTLLLVHITWRIITGKCEADEITLALLVVNPAAAFGIVYFQMSPAYHDWLGLAAVAFAGAHLFAAERIRNSVDEELERLAAPVLLLLGVALAFLTLAVPIQFATYRITVAWALEGAALIWIGKRTEAWHVTQSALIVFALALVRLLSLDSWIFTSGTQHAPLANARFFTFAVAAASFWFGAYWLEDKREKLATYVGGHFVLLWALVMEVVAQVERSVPADKVFSVASVSVSVLIAAYGVALIGAFVLGRFAVNRLLGLLLLAGVVVKLYVNDVWALDHVYRVIAFGFLGTLLLLTSFLYSRFRTRLGDWWKSDADPT